MDSFRYILYVYKRTILRTPVENGKRMETRHRSIRRREISLVGKTGGEKTHRHKLPNLFGHLNMGGTEIRATTVKLNSSTVWQSSVQTTVNVYADSSVHNAGLKISVPVDDDTDVRASSLQPYISVYVWRRTA